MLESKERTPIALQAGAFMNIIDSNKLLIKKYCNNDCGNKGYKTKNKTDAHSIGHGAIAVPIRTVHS